MKYIIYTILYLLISAKVNAQIENIIVETYYVSDANDATDTTGGYLQPGSKTYRIYVDLAPGSKIRKVYGDTYHPLRFTSTEDIFNNNADGQSFGKDFTKSRLQENTVALDSWITIGQTTRVASKTYFGIPKSQDADGSIIGGVNNDGGSSSIPGGLLVNTSSNAGLPLTIADGLSSMTNTPSAWADYGIKDFLTGDDTTIFGSKIGKEFLSYNAGLQNSGVAGVSPDSNQVLIAQITTLGDISFELNLEIEETIGGITQIVNYVANGDTLLPGERICPFLKYPAECGCTDARYLEYNQAFSCSNRDSCHTLIIYGCTDTMACNYDINANFNLPELCCYPGYCNDRDIEVVCPELTLKRVGKMHDFIYPNPARNMISVGSTNEADYNNEYRIFDQTGKLILSGSLGSSYRNIDISSMRAGVYLIEITGHEESFKQVLIKEN